MNDHFDKVRTYVLELGYSISHENQEDGILVVNQDSVGISNLVIGVADPILIFEQYIFDVDSSDANILKNLLMKNRDVVHGAFVLDDSGNRVIFRDTLQLENLDQNEVEGTLNSLKLLLGEYAEEIIEFSL